MAARFQRTTVSTDCKRKGDRRFASPDCRVQRGDHDHPPMVTFDPVRGLRHIVMMVVTVFKIEAGSLWAVERMEGVEAPASWS